MGKPTQSKLQEGFGVWSPRKFTCESTLIISCLTRPMWPSPLSCPFPLFWEIHSLLNHICNLFTLHYLHDFIQDGFGFYLGSWSFIVNSKFEPWSFCFNKFSKFKVEKGFLKAKNIKQIVCLVVTIIGYHQIIDYKFIILVYFNFWWNKPDNFLIRTKKKNYNSWIYLIE